MRRLTSFALLFLLGCGGESPPAPVTVVDARPSANAGPSTGVASTVLRTTKASSADELEIVEDGAPGGTMSPIANEATEATRKGAWELAAMDWGKVARGETGDSQPIREIGSYQLAEAFYRLGLHQACYGVFAEITSKPTHVRFRQSLQWLVRLREELPETALVFERANSVSREVLSSFDGPRRTRFSGELASMMGRYAYSSRRYADAIALFGKVGDDNPRFEEAVYFSGLAHHQMQDPEAAKKSFEQLISFEAAHPGRPDAAVWTIRAQGSLARTWFEQGFTKDAKSAAKIDGEKVNHALQVWSTIDPTGAGSEWEQLEAARSQILTGDDARALALLPATESLASLALKSLVQGHLCKKPEAAATLTLLRNKYGSKQKELAAFLHRAPVDGELTKELVSTPSGGSSLGVDLGWALGDALQSGSLRSHVDYFVRLQAEQNRLTELGPAFAGSAVGDDALDAITLAKDLVSHNLETQARTLLEAKLGELDSILGPASGAPTTQVSVFPTIASPGLEEDLVVGWSFHLVPVPPIPSCKTP